MHDDFTVGVRLELRWILQPHPERQVIINLPIHCEDDAFILVDQWLRSGILA